MKKRFCLMPVLLLLALLGSVANASVPPVFVDMEYEEAAKRAADENKLLILDAMTSWCGPCKQMDKTTWVDADLVKWLEANAISIQLDMDEHEALKDELGITAFPTIIAFKGDLQDRVVGLQSAAFMMEWLRALQKGETRGQALLKQLADVQKGAIQMSVADRAELTSELINSKFYEPALEEWKWLWENTGEEKSSYGFPLKNMLPGILNSIVRGHEPARAVAKQCFDEITQEVAKSPTRDTLGMWRQFANMAGKTETVVNWGQRMAETKKGQAVLKTSGLFGLFSEHGAWKAAGYSIGDKNTKGYIEAYAHLVAKNNGTEPPAGSPGMYPGVRSEGRTQPEQIDFQMRSEGAERYVSLLSVGRTAEANDVAEFLFKYAGDKKAAHAAVVDYALRAGVFDKAAEQHRQWLWEVWK
ncbi:thioredoxin family protein [Porticoccaceae bacterium LTM1]|nr:thioredoxin family protein [Porticoccaceae bacterium LTM1]